jgi:hypothetical protein
MALILCHECQAEISDQAQACPKCGSPSRHLHSGFLDENLSLKIFCLIAFLASLLFLILGIIADAEEQEAFNEWQDCKSIFGDNSSIGGPCQDEWSHSLAEQGGGGAYFWSILCFITFLVSVNRLKKKYM